ncbi:MAG: RHS repeat-associated core domain-containing protein [Archangium sp.]|nr:RHS repeat-associated core domain-containing protein [Archangium sp.]
MNDITVPSALGPLTFRRRYTSSAYAYAWHRIFSPSGPTAPFGRPATGVNFSPPHWLHNWASFIKPDSSPDGGKHFDLLDTSGRILQFEGCTAPCYAASESTNGDMLYVEDARYTLLRGTEGRFVYERDAGIDGGPAAWTAFLTRWEDSQHPASGESPRIRAVLSYTTQPCAGNPPGQPAVASVATLEGTRLEFDYADSGVDGGDCQLIRVRISKGASSETAVEFSVAGGLITEARYGADAGFIGYGSNSLKTQNGVTVSQHSYTPYRSDFAQGSVEIFRASGDAGAWSHFVPTLGSTGLTQKGLGFSLTSMASSPYPLLTEISEGCEGWECSNAWVKNYGYTTVGANVGLVNWATDTRANYFVSAWDSGVTLPTGRATAELVSRFEGASASSGSGALQTTNYQYQYGSVGQTPRGYEQYLAEEKQASLLQGGSDAKSVTIRDSETNRVKAEFRVGWTKSYNESTATWSTVARTIGTFYFTSRKCTDDVADTFGRTLEIHGPCEVSSTSATDCSSGSVIPVTQYAYFGTGDGGVDAHQLQSETRWVNATDPEDCTGTSLTTTFGNYDVRGHARSVTDPNGVVTTFTYSDGLLATSTVNGNTTNYAWDNGVLRSIQHPEGNYDVFCHRSASLGSACSGTWTPQLQWHARAPNADGTGYTEATASFYTSDGRLLREEDWDGVQNEKRRERVFDEDSEGKRLRTTVGVGAAAYYVMKRYDADGVLTGTADGVTGSACGLQASSGGAGSNTCANIQNDAMGRLAAMDVAGAVSGETGRTCVTYDAQGNVATVKLGCSSDPSSYPGPSCSSCTQPALTYQHDDFGNVVSFSAPHLGSGSGGTISSTFDARGNMLLRQTPAMVADAARLKYTFDGLGRQLSAVHAWNSPSSGSQTLSSSLYDDAASLSGTCPQPTNTKGRLLKRTDSFGDTWYQYSAEGWLTGEVRMRSGSSCSSRLPRDIPHTLYSYTANGNLASMTYPYGRTVTYSMGTSGGKTTDKPASISVTMWDGSAWNAWTAISNIVFEPFGGVRAYQQGTSSATSVEYFTGPSAQYPPTSTCPMTTPASGNDYSGRRRLLHVSTGALSLGGGSGNIFQEFRAWEGLKTTLVGTCWESGYVSQWTPSYYRDQLRNSIYGTYDVRGNRTAMNAQMYGSVLDTYNYAADAGVDWLTSITRAGSPTVPPLTFAYDVDGRTTAIRSGNDSTGTAAFEELWTPSATGAASAGGLDSVYKTVSVSGAVYAYYYDGENKRRLKEYPTSVTDEYFYDTSKRLLVDRGNAELTSPGWYTTDEYVWLGEKPVVVVRGRLSTTDDTRSSDATASCGRNGEAQACGAYFIITDELPRPLALLDDTGKHAKRMKWDGFGAVNRTELRKQTAHPYSQNTYESLFWEWLEFTGATRFRFDIEMLDSEGTAASPVDFFEVRQNYVAQATAGGAHRGRVYTNWVEADGGSVQLAFLSNSRSCPPEGCLTDGGLPDGGSWPYWGALVAAIEVEESQSGAKRFDTPLRFPGQYFDGETQKHENWNRFYDPMTGRYLSPEPMLQLPEVVAGRARQARPLASYSYASNNPLYYVDEDGLLDTWTNHCKNVPEDPACTGTEVAPKPKPNRPGPAPKPDPKLPPDLPPPLPDDCPKDPPKKDICTPHYVKCVAQGGDTKPGRVHGESLCNSCFNVCMSPDYGYWPQAIYTWDRKRIECPGR